MQLSDRRDSRVDPLSGGMKRRLTIARALINQPEVLLLDEPTTGLDPQARHMLWERLYRLKQQGVTLVLTTHYMDEAEQLCDRLVIMDGGRIVAEGTPRDLIADARDPGGGGAALRPRGRPARRAARASATLAARVEPVADRVLVYTDDGDRTAAGGPGRRHRCRVRARAAREPRRRLPHPHRPHARGVGRVDPAGAPCRRT